jgi:putative aldouronate transport system permease protein
MRLAKRSRFSAKFGQDIHLHLMLLPAVALLLIYSYIPMFGNVMAFQKFNPSQGFLRSTWVGLENFRYVFALPDTLPAIRNTLVIAISKMAMGIIAPLIFALLLNELRNKYFRGTIQTIVNFPHFLSWVILSGILLDVLSPSEGIANAFIKLLGGTPIYFLGNKTWFPITLVLSETWKEFGYGAIIYLAALTAIDSGLYDAAAVDGANRWQQTLHVTLPGISSTIVLMMALSLGNILNAGFEQVFNLYSPQVYATGDIIDTLVYRIGVIQAQYSVATAVGLFKSVVSFILLSLSYWLAYRFTDYRLF